MTIIAASEAATRFIELPHCCCPIRDLPTETTINKRAGRSPRQPVKRNSDRKLTSKGHILVLPNNQQIQVPARLDGLHQQSGVTRTTTAKTRKPCLSIMVA